MNNEADPTEMSITYSSQVEDLCRDIGAEAYIVSSHDRKEVLRDGPFALEHRPKPMLGATGVRFHLGEILYGCDLLAAAVRFRANTAILGFRIKPLFYDMPLSIVRQSQPVIILHNTLWPSGFSSDTAGAEACFAPCLPVLSMECESFSGAVAGVHQTSRINLRTVSTGHFMSLEVSFDRSTSKTFLHPRHTPPASVFELCTRGGSIRLREFSTSYRSLKRIEQLQPGRVEWEILRNRTGSRRAQAASSGDGITNNSVHSWLELHLCAKYEAGLGEISLVHCADPRRFCGRHGERPL